MVLVLPCTCVANWCGCSPRKMAGRKEKRAWKEELNELKRNQEMLYVAARHTMDIEEELDAGGGPQVALDLGGTLSS